MPPDDRQVHHRPSAATTGAGIALALSLLATLGFAQSPELAWPPGPGTWSSVPPPAVHRIAGPDGRWYRAFVYEVAGARAIRVRELPAPPQGRIVCWRRTTETPRGALWYETPLLGGPRGEVWLPLADRVRGATDNIALVIGPFASVTAAVAWSTPPAVERLDRLETWLMSARRLGAWIERRRAALGATTLGTRPGYTDLATAAFAIRLLEAAARDAPNAFVVQALTPPEAGAGGTLNAASEAPASEASDAARAEQPAPDWAAARYRHLAPGQALTVTVRGEGFLRLEVRFADPAFRERPAEHREVALALTLPGARAADDETNIAGRPRRIRLRARLSASRSVSAAASSGTTAPGGDAQSPLVSRTVRFGRYVPVGGAITIAAPAGGGGLHVKASWCTLKRTWLGLAPELSPRIWAQKARAAGDPAVAAVARRLLGERSDAQETRVAGDPLWACARALDQLWFADERANAAWPPAISGLPDPLAAFVDAERIRLTGWQPADADAWVLRRTDPHDRALLLAALPDLWMSPAAHPVGARWPQGLGMLERGREALADRFGSARASRAVFAETGYWSPQVPLENPRVSIAPALLPRLVRHPTADLVRLRPGYTYWPRARPLRLVTRAASRARFVLLPKGGEPIDVWTLPGLQTLVLTLATEFAVSETEDVDVYAAVRGRRVPAPDGLSLGMSPAARAAALADWQAKRDAADTEATDRDAPGWPPAFLWGTPIAERIRYQVAPVVPIPRAEPAAGADAQARGRRDAPAPAAAGVARPRATRAAPGSERRRDNRGPKHLRYYWDAAPGTAFWRLRLASRSGSFRGTFCRVSATYLRGTRERPARGPDAQRLVLWSGSDEPLFDATYVAPLPGGTTGVILRAEPGNALDLGAAVDLRLLRGEFRREPEAPPEASPEASPGASPETPPEASPEAGAPAVADRPVRRPPAGVARLSTRALEDSDKPESPSPLPQPLSLKENGASVSLPEVPLSPPLSAPRSAESITRLAAITDALAQLEADDARVVAWRLQRLALLTRIGERPSAWVELAWFSRASAAVARAAGKPHFVTPFERAVREAAPRVAALEADLWLLAGARYHVLEIAERYDTLPLDLRRLYTSGLLGDPARVLASVKAAPLTWTLAGFSPPVELPRALTRLFPGLRFGTLPGRVNRWAAPLVARASLLGGGVTIPASGATVAARERPAPLVLADSLVPRRASPTPAPWLTSVAAAVGRLDDPTERAYWRAREAVLALLREASRDEVGRASVGPEEPEASAGGSEVPTEAPTEAPAGEPGSRDVASLNAAIAEALTRTDLPAIARQRLERGAALVAALPRPRVPGALDAPFSRAALGWTEAADVLVFAPLRPGRELTGYTRPRRLFSASAPGGFARYRLGEHDRVRVRLAGPGVLRVRARRMTPWSSGRVAAALAAGGAPEPKPLIFWTLDGTPREPLVVSVRPSETVFGAALRPQPGEPPVFVRPTGERSTHFIRLGPGLHRLEFSALDPASVQLARAVPGPWDFVTLPRLCADLDTFVAWANAASGLGASALPAPGSAAPGSAAPNAAVPAAVPAADWPGYAWPLVPSPGGVATVLRSPVREVGAALADAPGRAGLKAAWPALVRALGAPAALARWRAPDTPDAPGEAPDHALPLPPKRYSIAEWDTLAEAVRRTPWERLRNVLGTGDLVWVQPLPGGAPDLHRAVREALVPQALREQAIVLSAGERWQTEPSETPLSHVTLMAYVRPRASRAFLRGPVALRLLSGTARRQAAQQVTLPVGRFSEDVFAVPTGPGGWVSLELPAERDDVTVFVRVTLGSAAGRSITYPAERRQRWLGATVNAPVVWQVPGGAILRLDVVADRPLELSVRQRGGALSERLRFAPAAAASGVNPGVASGVGSGVPRVPGNGAPSASAPGATGPPTRTGIWFAVPGTGPQVLAVKPVDEYGLERAAYRVPVRAYVLTPPGVLDDADTPARTGAAVEPVDAALADARAAREPVAPALEAGGGFATADERSLLSESAPLAERAWTPPAIGGVLPFGFSTERRTPLTLAAESSQRFIDEDTLGPRDFSFTGRFWEHPDDERLWWYARFGLRLSEAPDLLAEADARLWWEPWADVPLALIGSARVWAQPLMARDGLDAGGRLFGLRLRGELGLRGTFALSETWRLWVSASVFGQLLPRAPDATLAQLLDPRVFSDYKRDQPHGGTVELDARYAPVADVEIGARTRARFNEAFASLDYWQVRGYARLFADPLEIAPEMRVTAFFADADRARDNQEIDLRLRATLQTWTVSGDLWRVYGAIDYRFGRSTLIFSVGVSFTFGARGSYAHRDPSLATFRSVRRYDPWYRP